MLRIRLARVGAKRKPAYRVVVIDQKRARDSRFVEIVGHYDPLAKPAAISLDQDRIAHWVKCGAQPTITVSRLMKNAAPAS
ncbi:MAG: 30S ribosomal protein S16 [Bryobacteraceae bacterium]